MNCRQLPYQTLQPDVWTECLSYLPPDKLSMASELLPLMPLPPTNNGPERDNDDDHAEHAAWLAVRSMVRIAEKHWEAQQAKAAEETKKDEAKWNASSEEYRSSTYIWDPFELQKLVSNDTTILGDLLRKSKNRGGSATSGRSGKRTRRRSFFRFRDETWQGLYGLLYKVLSDSLEVDSIATNEQDLLEFWEELFGEQAQSSIGVHDKESIALVVGLVFGAPPIPSTLMTPPVHQKLARIARACIACSSRDEKDQKESADRKRENRPYLLSDARCYLLSLRLADEGFWDIASKILQSRSLLAVADERKTAQQPTDSDATIGDELLLSIDGMIYMSTFLIDRLYSQTYVRMGEDDQELAIAIRAGRKAVEMAGKRYKALKADQTITKFEGWSPFESKIETEPQNMNLPPPPMDSLFANDVLRYIHAKLALGKALALLAQHIGLDASDTDSLRDLRVFPVVQPKFESPMTTPEIEAEDFARWQRMEDRPSIRIQICWTESFFIESQKQLDDGIVVCEELMDTGTTPSRDVAAALSPLLGALKSAKAERDYCAASAAFFARKPLKTEYLAVSSIRGFYATFKYTMDRILEEMSQPKDFSLATGSRTEAALDVLLRCGKDLGKACGFADYSGVEYTQISDRFPDPQHFLDFALLVSIHKHGFFHPTSVNVARLSKQRSSDSSVQPIEQKYHAVATWLQAEYGGKTS